jgi:threonine synthase
MAAVKETGGAYIAVTDEEILAAIPALARGSGVFAEPAGATAYAGLKKAIEEDLVAADERIVVINTGNGLKDVAGAMKGVALTDTKAQHVKPDIEHLKRLLKPE